MLNLDTNKLQECWPLMQKVLKDGLLAGDIWDRESGLSLAGVNPLPEASALFSSMTEELDETLADSGFPGLNRYFMLNLEEDKLFVIIRHGDDLLQGLLLNPKKAKLGILFSVAIPKAIAHVAQARLSN